MFPEATPTVNVSVFEAQAAEDNPAASADDNQEYVRVPTPPNVEEAVPDVNVPVPNPPARQVEVENLEAATTNANEANDIVMAEANVELAPTSVSEANEATAFEAPVVQPEASVAATAHVPPPRPYTIEQAYNHGQLTTVRWPILVPPPTASGPQFDYHVEHRPQVQKPKPRLPRFPGTSNSTGSFNANGFISHNTFFDSA